MSESNLSLSDEIYEIRFSTTYDHGSSEEHHSVVATLKLKEAVQKLKDFIDGNQETIPSLIYKNAHRTIVDYELLMQEIKEIFGPQLVGDKNGNN